MILSILTPSLYSRLPLLNNLVNILSKQTNGKNYIEHLTLIDNYGMSVGEKRNKLIDMSKGRYIVFVDDDDEISDDYIVEIFKGIVKNVDIITFDIKLYSEIFKFILNNKHNLNNSVKKPNHLCVVRKEIIENIRFEDWNRGEDDKWANDIIPLLNTEYHIDKILYHYKYDENISTINLQN